MRRDLLMDVRTGEGGNLAHFFQKCTNQELGRYIKPVTPRELQETQRRIQEAKENNKP